MSRRTFPVLMRKCLRYIMPLKIRLAILLSITMIKRAMRENLELLVAKVRWSLPKKSNTKI
jgi:predicted GTPase